MSSSQLLRMSANPRDLARAPRAVSAAWLRAGNRATREVANWTRTQALRVVSQAEDIPVSRLRSSRRAAVRVTRRAGADSALTWVGIDAIKAGRLGKPRQLRAGVRVGKHHFPDAFVRTMPSGYVGVFERMGKSGGGAQRWTKGRPQTSSPNLPLVDELLPLRRSDAALRGIEPRVPVRLTSVMQRLLDLEMRRAGR